MSRNLSSIRAANPQGLARAEAYAPIYRAQLAEWSLQPEERMVDTACARTHLLVWGPADAPPLVLLHGAGASALTWLHMAEALGAHRRVYALDVPGHAGLSVARRLMRRTLDHLIWLDEVCDELQFRRVDLGGISMGGAFSANYALHAPTRLQQLVLIAPALTLLPMRTAFYLNGLPLFLGTAGTERFLRYLGPKTNAGQEPYETRLRGAIHGWTTGRRHFGMFQSVGVEYPAVFTDKQLRNLSVPTLVAIGDHEVIYDAQKALARAAAQLPNARTALIPGAGHDILWSQPERLSSAIVEFFSQK